MLLPPPPCPPRHCHLRPLPHTAAPDAVAAALDRLAGYDDPAGVGDGGAAVVGIHCGGGGTIPWEAVSRGDGAQRSWIRSPFHS